MKYMGTGEELNLGGVNRPERRGAEVHPLADLLKGADVTAGISLENIEHSY